MTARRWWKLYWRMLRVARCESLKAVQDMAIYGTGVVAIDDKGPRHVPHSEFFV